MKRKVKYELVASFEAEIDLESEAYKVFPSIEAAVDYDLEQFMDDPVFFLELDREMDFEVTGDIHD